MHHIERTSLPTLIVVSGVPGTGKTTLGLLLRERLAWPLLSKDRIKETLYDASGLGLDHLTRTQSWRYGVQSELVLYEIARELLSSGVSCIIESNFLPAVAVHDLKPFAALGSVRQLHCVVPAHVSIGRYKTRFEAGLRHPVHLDREEAEDRAASPIPDSDLLPVPLDGPLLSINTEVGYCPSLETILSFCLA